MLNLVPQVVSVDVLLEKYAKDGEKSIFDVRSRVAKALASIEKNKAKWEKDFLYALENGFIPGGRINSAAGTDINATLINCFVQPISDCLYGKNGEVGIFDALSQSAQTQAKGGGVGYDFSPLRPRHGYVKGTKSKSSGPVSYMRIFDRMCETLESAGARRGAQMGVLRVNHPDILEFVNAKKHGDLKNFNISVGVSDAFMSALKSKQKIQLIHEAEPTQAYIESNGCYQLADGDWVYGEIEAEVLWNTIMENTYNGAEPGVLYMDAINSKNNLSYCEYIYATNPCGEQPLPAYGCCDLGSLNLTMFVNNPFTQQASFDFDKFDKVVSISARALDNVLDLTVWPLEQQHAESMAKRRIGLGFTGLGSALVMLGIPYNKPKAHEFATNVTRQLAISSYSSSVQTAIEKGSFPLFDADKYLAEPHFASKLPESVKAQIRKHGIRNSHLTSIAPTGTISLAFGDNCSNGIEPAFSWTYQRKKRMSDGTHAFYDVEDHAYRLYREMGGDVNALPAQFISALEMSANDHLMMVKAVAPWIDSAISKTVNVPEDYLFDDFKDLYMQAFDSGLKGITTFRPNNITGSVLSVTPQDKPKVESPVIEPKVTFNNVPELAMNSLKWLKRPLLQDGNPSWTYMAKGPNFSFSINVGHIDNDMSPFEVWVNGAEQPRGLGALAKTLSYDMRSMDRKFLQQKLQVISETQGHTQFTHALPGGKEREYTNPAALFADLVLIRCDKLEAFSDLSNTSLTDSMFSNKETLTSSSGAMGWYVDVKNPITGEQFVMVVKEGELPDGTKVPYGVSLSDGFQPSLLGLTKSLSMDMQVADPSWISEKLRDLSDFVEPNGNFFASIPGTTKQKDYPSTVAYMVDLIRHRYVMLGILDEDGKPVKKTGALEVVEANKVKYQNVKVKGLKCPECSEFAVFTQGGCKVCSACGHLGSCG